MVYCRQLGTRMYWSFHFHRLIIILIYILQTWFQASSGYVRSHIWIRLWASFRLFNEFDGYYLILSFLFVIDTVFYSVSISQKKKKKLKTIYYVIYTTHKVATEDVINLKFNILLIFLYPPLLLIYLEVLHILQYLIRCFGDIMIID